MWLFGLLILGGSVLVASHFPPWTAFQQEVVAAAGVAIAGVATLAHQRKWSWPRSAIALLLVATVPLLQAAFGLLLFAADGVFASLYLVAFALSIALGATLTDRYRDLFLDVLFGALLAAAIFSAGLALAQLLRVPLPPFDVMPMAPGGRPYGNLAQPNHLATLLLLGVAFAGWMFEKRRIGAVGLTLTLSMLGVALVATQSRTAIVGGLAVLACMVWLNRRGASRIAPAAAIGMGLLFVALTVAWPGLLQLIDMNTSRSLGEMADRGHRWTMWPLFVDAALRSPWVGYGWNQVVVAQGQVAASNPAVPEMLDHSHSLFLDLVLWNGLPLGILLIGGLLWWFIRQGHATRTPSQGALLTALLAVAVHALFEYPLSYSYFLLPFGLMMGAMEAQHPLGARVQVPVWVTAPLVAGAIATTALIAVDYVDIDDNHRRLRMETMGLVAGSTANDVPDARVATNWREFLVFTRTSARSGMTAEQLERMRRVYLRFPQPPVLLRYAIATGLNGRPQDARESLVRLCKMHPRKRCEEGREAWTAMQQRHLELAAVAFPEPFAEH